MAQRDDPYISLEEIDSDDSLHFATQSNQACLKALGDPTKSKSQSYKRILEVLETDDRIPFVSKMGRDDRGNDLLYNLWKDSKVSWTTENCAYFRWNYPPHLQIAYMFLLLTLRT
jgi:prolyl oligopeptidase PreP (S9A serine peptidase family)